MIKIIKNPDLKKSYLRISITLILSLIFISQTSLHNAALARSSGGGDLSKFDTGTFVLNVGMSVGGSLLGNYIGNSLSSTLGLGNNALQNTSFINQLANGYSTYLAASQVGSAVGYMGTYHDWSNSAIYVTQGLATGATSGFLNPELSLGSTYKNLASKELAETGISTLTNDLSTMLKGAATGALGGTAQGLTVVAIDGDKINSGESPGAGAQIAGIAAGIAATNLGRKAFDPYLDSKTLAYGERVDPEKLPSGEGNRYTVINPEGVVEEITLEPGEELASADGYRLVGSDDKIYRIVDSESVGIENRSTGDKFVTEDYFTSKHSKLLAASQPAGDSPIKAYRITPTISKIVQTHADVGGAVVAKRLFSAAITDTLDQYPSLASSYVGMVLTDKLGDNWSTLSHGFSNAVVGSVLSNMRDFYALSPALYVGDESEVTDRRLARAYMLKSYGRKQGMSDFISEINSIVNEYEDQDDPDLAEMTKKINTAWTEGGPDRRDILSASPLGDSLKDTNQEAMAIFTSSVAQQKKDFSYRAGTEKEREATADSFKQILDEKKVSPVHLIRNAAIVIADKQLTFNMAQAPSVDGALKLAKAEKGKLFLNFTGDSIRFNALSAMVGGGIAAGFNHLEDDVDSPVRILSALASNMGTAVARGLAYHYGWQEAGNDWHRRWDYVEPVSYEQKHRDQFEEAKKDGKEFYQHDKFDLFGYLDSRTNYLDEKLKWQEFQAVTGAIPGEHKERTKFDFDGKEYVESPVKVVMTEFLDQKPSLKYAIGASLQQATSEIAANSLSFGRPMVRSDLRDAAPGLSPSQISASTFLSYVSQLRYASGLGLNEAIADSAVDANVGAISNSIMSIASQSSNLSRIFRIQPQRLTKVIFRHIPVSYAEITVGTAETGENSPTSNIRTFKFAKGEKGIYRKGNGDLGSLSEEEINQVLPNYTNVNMEKEGARKVLASKNTKDLIISEDISKKINAYFNELKESSKDTGQVAVKTVKESREAYSATSMKLPFTVQSLEYDGGSAVTVTSFYAPFPNALFSAQPQIGPGYYLRQAPSAVDSGNSSTNFVGDSIEGIVVEDLSE